MFYRLIILSLILLTSAAGALAAKDAGDPVSRAGRLWQQGRFEQAEQAFKAALAAEPSSARIHARLAAFYLSRQRADDAIAHYQEAILLEPKNPKLFVGIAIAYLHKQHYGMAQAMVERALELDPSLANAQKLGEYVRARKRMLARAHAASGAADPAPPK